MRFKKALRSIIRFSSLIFMLVTLVSSIMGFWVLWKDNATILPRMRPSSSISRQGDITTVFREETLSVKNYLPINNHIEFGLIGINFEQTSDDIQYVSTHYFLRIDGLGEVEEYCHFTMKWDELFYNSSQVVCEFDDVVIEELQIRHFYGDEALSDPEILIKPKQVWYDEYVLPFSDVLIDFKWSYSYNESEVYSIYGRELDRRLISFRWQLNTTIPNKLLFWFNKISNLIFSRKNRYFWWKILPLTSFFLLGIALANVNSKKIQPLMKSFYFITQLQNQEISDNIKSELKKELDTLAYRRHLLFGHGSHIIVGPAFSFFLMAVRSKLNRLRYRCKLETLELSKDIETFLKDNATSTSAGLFNTGSLTLFLGFLASIGFSFNWNIGIINPIILTIGIIYLCLNLGFLSFIIRKSKWDLTYSLLLFLFILIVTIMPDLLPWLRIELRGLHI